MLLALARLFVAPEPSPVPTTDGETTLAAAEEATPLLPIDFRPRARTLEASQPAYDLRNPFRTSTVRATAPAPSKAARRRRASSRRPDLRDPFAEPSRKRHGAPKPADDLRDPFTQPAPALRKCPDTGGVPIQRPDTVEAGCAQASRRMVLAKR